METKWLEIVLGFFHFSLFLFPSFLSKQGIDLMTFPTISSFAQLGASQIISGLQNFDRGNVASVVTAADMVGTIFRLHLFYRFPMKICENCLLIAQFRGFGSIRCSKTNSHKSFCL